MSHNFKDVEDLTFSDSYMFEAVIKNKKIAKVILGKMLGITVARIEYPDLSSYPDLMYRTLGVRIELYQADTGVVHEVEFRTKTGNITQSDLRGCRDAFADDYRFRCLSNERNRRYWVIYIGSFEDKKNEKVCYTSDDIKKEERKISDNVYLDYKIYNAQFWNKAENKHIKAFLRYYETGKATDELTSRINNMVKEMLEDDTFRIPYMKVYYAYYSGRFDGEEDSVSGSLVYAAKIMIERGVSPDIVCEATDLDMDAVIKLKKEGGFDEVIMAVLEKNEEC